MSLIHRVLSWIFYFQEGKASCRLGDHLSHPWQFFSRGCINRKMRLLPLACDVCLTRHFKQELQLACTFLMPFLVHHFGATSIIVSLKSKPTRLLHVTLHQFQHHYHACHIGSTACFPHLWQLRAHLFSCIHNHAWNRLSLKSKRDSNQQFIYHLYGNFDVAEAYVSDNSFSPFTLPHVPLIVYVRGRVRQHVRVSTGVTIDHCVRF